MFLRNRRTCQEQSAQYARKEFHHGTTDAILRPNWQTEQNVWVRLLGYRYVYRLAAVASWCGQEAFMKAMILFALAIFLQGAPVEQGLSSADRYKQGHSAHGSAFDTGPRTRPVPMTDIGETHFAITAKNPEVQKWLDQGNTLLHSFSDYEAERAFRWALKLEPDNAMVFWGLARAASDPERSREFLSEAAKRKSKVTERERLYIEALEALHRIDTLRDRRPALPSAK